MMMTIAMAKIDAYTRREAETFGFGQQPKPRATATGSALGKRNEYNIKNHDKYIIFI